MILTGGALALLVNALTSVFKLFIYPKFGKIGVQVVSFAIALVLAWLFIYGRQIESVWNLIVAAGALFSAAVAIYEVLLQRIDLFKVNTYDVKEARVAERRG